MAESEIRPIGRPNKSGKRYRPNQTPQQKRRERERNSAWKKKNRAKLNKYMKDWRDRNIDHHRRYMRDRHYTRPPTQKQIENRRKRSTQWAKENPERVSENIKKWNKANPGRGAERTARWKKRNPDKATESSRASSRNRRAAKRKSEGHHTAADIARIMEQQRGRCAYCPRSIRKSRHVDHIKPLSKGGSNWPRNIQLTCGPCNLKKNAKDPIEFARSIGKLI